LQYDKQDQVERSLDLLEGKDPDTSRQKLCMRQSETHASGQDDNTGPHKPGDGAVLERCPPNDSAPAMGAGTPAGQQMQPPGDSEENVPRGVVDTIPVRFCSHLSIKCACHYVPIDRVLCMNACSDRFSAFTGSECDERRCTVIMEKKCN
jgi:hypothetical protein